MADVYFLSEVKKSMMVWKISDLITKAGHVLKSHLLFLHAWSGCDTTSATFGHGKTSLLKRIKESKEIQQISSLMSEHSATAEQIGKAGTRLYVITYGGRQEDSLNGLRYMKFMEMVRYRSNATSHSLDYTLLVARSKSTFAISSRQTRDSKITLHLVYSKTFIKQGYLTQNYMVLSLSSL